MTTIVCIIMATLIINTTTHSSRAASSTILRYICPVLALGFLTNLPKVFSSSSTLTCPVFEPLYHIFTNVVNNLRKVQFRMLKTSVPWSLSIWTWKIIEISSVFWGTARLSRRKGLGELVSSPWSELLDIFKKSYYIWVYWWFLFSFQFCDPDAMRLLHPGTRLTGL